MSNYKDLYDYGLTGANIEVWPTETDGPAPITIDAAAFFAWLYDQDYVLDVLEARTSVSLVYVNGFRIWETWAEWWADPRVISKPGEFDGDKGLLGQLLCMYLNDPANERFTDCRTVADLPSAFLTAAEKAAKQ